MAVARFDSDHFEEEVFEFVRKSQEMIVNTGRDMMKRVSAVVPEQVPMVRELAKDVFDFTEDSLRLQREFAQNVLQRTRRAVEGASRGPARRPGSRASAAKATGAPRRHAAQHSAA